MKKDFIISAFSLDNSCYNVWESWNPVYHDLLPRFLLSILLYYVIDCEKVKHCLGLVARNYPGDRLFADLSEITSCFVLRPIFDTSVLIFWSLTLVRLQNFHVVVSFQRIILVPRGTCFHDPLYRGRVGSARRGIFLSCTYIKGREIWRT